MRLAYCIDLLRGRLVPAYNDLRSFFIIVIFEVIQTLVEILASIVYLFGFMCLILESLIQTTVNNTFNYWCSCWRSVSPWLGIEARSALSQEYKHLPLRKNRDIRLFQLYRWIPCLGVRDTLCNFSLDCMPSYEAISYHWGTVSVTRKVYVDGKSFYGF